ncbi:hypothetical protein ES332_D09G234900v1 [Gossypium tomentosum]|uniref:Uncharacterized protein n=1 Tax=Gossypium tomentosum TaxID=34277 RepID=A0A5D2JLR9_GOSTO|nr:hypothetical protein ES332_D09G234900v1 [Gossypium tomentosum]
MAAASNKTFTPQSNSTNTHFTLLFILLLLLVSPAFASRPPPACPSSCYDQLFSSSSASNSHPFPAPTTAAAEGSPRDRRFKGAAHEVPSGPNPESN